MVTTPDERFARKSTRGSDCHRFDPCFICGSACISFLIVEALVRRTGRIDSSLLIVKAYHDKNVLKQYCFTCKLF